MPGKMQRPAESYWAQYTRPQCAKGNMRDEDKRLKARGRSRKSGETRA